MISTKDIDDIIGAEAVGPDDDRIGKVGQIYIDQDDEQPVWVSVKSGLFGTSESLVPLQGAEWDRSALHLAFPKDRVKDAPRVDPDGELSSEEQERLYEYYGMGASGSGSGSSRGDRDRDLVDRDRDRGSDDDRVVDDPIASDRDRYTAAGGGEGAVDAGSETGFGAGAAGAGLAADADRTRTGGERGVGHDTSDRNTDDAMTRSEERLHVGTERVQAGRARLRKYVVTENQTVTVPVTREEVRLEREPITDGNRGAALDGPDLSEEEHEIVLTEERPVVQKETVPVERVRLEKEAVAGEQQVTEDVRHEEIVTDDDRATGRTDRR
ncbi:PRC and DUF2382 domain-containing protein [Amnibacterium soli]|uniref:PRC and DUF2382 domain-containing protein n=1 Tax=Amnibacterium soli TaxID=1282736 RepID=A0ABP8ZFV1_9MICO